MDKQHPDIAFQKYFNSLLPSEAEEEIIARRMKVYAREYMQAASVCAISGSAQVIEQEFDQDNATWVILEALMSDDDEWPFIAHVKTAFTEELIVHTYHRGATPAEAIAFAIAAAYVDRIYLETPAG